MLLLPSADKLSLMTENVLILLIVIKKVISMNFLSLTQQAFKLDIVDLKFFNIHQV